jgi:hypothetical protein
MHGWLGSGLHWTRNQVKQHSLMINLAIRHCALKFSYTFVGHFGAD